MKYNKIPNTDIEISQMGLGTWAFGNDRWWGHQESSDTWQVLETAIMSGVNLIDTAPAYGRGFSEQVIGEFIKEKGVRDKVVLATKLGLSWKERWIFHDLSVKRMQEELDESRQRLQTDYIDLYQVHWPDKANPIEATAELMHSWYQNGIIKAIGVSNFSVEQMQTFMKYAPIHTLQPPYNMFTREIEETIVPFCLENSISILSYIPLHSGILTGKFFFDNVVIPGDICRKKHKDLKEPLFTINKDALLEVKGIADIHKVSLSQFVLNWTVSQPGITSILVGSRTPSQFNHNNKFSDFTLSQDDSNAINDILTLRATRIDALETENNISS